MNDDFVINTEPPIQSNINDINNINFESIV